MQEGASVSFLDNTLQMPVNTRVRMFPELGPGVAL